MSTATTAVQPAERQDIHKSCRTIETLLNVLSDYCEAANAFTTIQKKLAKALRDAAGSKTNAQFAANAFGASANIFEVLVDVDAKFAKIAEKEYGSVSSEVKKWFKKLAKEEKAHDERMNDSNARIKQAGQAYEKKSKKGGRDAGEEHARYINLLSVVGPEMSQEKYNHAVLVTRQHISATFNVAASLSRIADAGWTRTCESMRRCSPAIGPLGEWRALCEGAWTGSLPDDLPEVSHTEGYPLPGPTNIPAVSEWGQTGLSTPNRRSLPIPPLGGHSPGTPSAHTILFDPPRPAHITNDQHQGSINSITTLSAFPFPPTHFPVPLAMNEAELQRQQILLQNHLIARSRASSPNPTQSQGVLAPPAHILTDSPKAIQSSVHTEILALADASKPPLSPLVPQTPLALQQFHPDACAQDRFGPTTSPEGTESGSSVVPGGEPQKPRRPSLITQVPQNSDKPKLPFRPESPFKRMEQASTEKEFGVQPDSSSRSAFKSHSVDAAKKNIERTNSTASSGNHVAALRNRYSRTIETPAQGPKDIPRLPMSVSEIATRYRPVDELMSPQRTASPITDRFPLPMETPARQTTRDMPIDDNELRRRKQRIEELTGLELKEKEFALRQRERELDQRTRDFERDRLQFLTSRPDPNATDGPKGPRNSPFQHKRGSQSVSHINPPSSTGSTLVASPPLPRPSTSHSPTRSQPSTLLPSKDHAPFCGCGTCSVSKYKSADVTPSPHDLRPPEPPFLLRPEKPKGWIRRLSMPSVNAAFSLDGKKNASAVSLKSWHPLPTESGRLRKRSFDQGISHRTVTGIGR
ncbi:hypothetical protein PAXINDRAFT_117227 [Paxillus involutus ATCC 200175]|uniref:Uncharacterized protein n=1 Tax=Paxillus involutus ATCC 200175 TaxID=664439 RepID=A0A0C9TD14_PAXIN|nr:hypothetical protein PAXINDRAFT_117227 [Paxillus involutus ATCC 200175]